MYQNRWLVPLGVALSLLAGCAQLPLPAEPPPTPPIAQAGDTTVVAVAPAERNCCSVWDLLGVGQVLGGVRVLGTAIRSRLGTRFPGLEPRPPLLTITDPANLGPDASPAVQTAAEVKAEEDQAAQKAKAINYLATIGCGGCDRGVEEALMAALEDCTEEVRYAAAKAFRDLSGSPCAVCKTDACCSEKALKKLNFIANETIDGCYVEPSPRVRRMARLAVAGCGGYVAGAAPAEVLPEEGPTPADLPPGPPVPAGGGVEARSILRGSRSAQTSGSGSRPQDPLVARVNGEPIYRSELEPQVASRLTSLRELTGGEPTEAMERTVRQKELEALVQRRVMLQAARREVPASLVDQVGYQTLVSPGRRPERILSDLGRSHAADPEQLVRSFMQQRLGGEPAVSEDELRRYYQAHRADYEVPPSVSWEEITVPIGGANSREHARSVIRYLYAVAQGQPLSPAPVFQRQNVITRAHPLTPIDRIESRQLAAHLMNLSQGRISEPWEDETGWHLTRVLERRAPRTRRFEEVREAVQAAVVARRREVAERQLVERLRREAQVWTIFEGPEPASVERAEAGSFERTEAGGNEGSKAARFEGSSPAGSGAAHVAPPQPASDPSAAKGTFPPSYRTDRPLEQPPLVSPGTRLSATAADRDRLPPRFPPRVPAR